MNCPRCETVSLTEMIRDGVTIDRCARCKGIWLDRGELEKLIAYGRAEADGDRDEEGDDDERRGHRGGRRSWWEIFD